MKRVFIFCALSSAVFGQIPGPPPVPPNKVVARVDGRDVTAADVKSALETMPQEFEGLYRQNPVLALQQLFMMKHLAAEADKRKLAEESPLKEQLEIARANMLAAAMLAYEQNNFTPTAGAVNEFYTRNLVSFQRAKIKAVSISFGEPIAANASAEERARADLEAKMGRKQRTEEEARARAAEALAKLKSGAEFAQVVAEYSDDAASKAAAGDAGFILPDGPQPEAFRKAVFALKPGEMSEPLRQPGALVIVRLEEISAQPKADVELPIMQQLRQEHFKLWFDELSQRFQPAIQSPEFFIAPQPTGPPIPGLGPR